MFWWCSLVIHLLLNGVLCSASLKVVRNTSGSKETLNFDKVSNHLSAKYNSTDYSGIFNGPEILRPLVDQCFVYEAEKYYYRICPFRNVTQHEKSKYSLNFVTSTFHTVLGFWQGAIGASKHSTIDSLLFRNGSECDSQKHRRKVKLNLECLENTNNIRETGFVTDVVETKKCVYNIQLKSMWVCGLGSVYAHLDSYGKDEWNTLLGLRQKNIITEEEHDRYLNLLLLEYGIEDSETIEFQEQENIVEIDDLIRENEFLKAEIKLLKESLSSLQNNQ